MPKISIRPAERRDAAAIAAIIRRLGWFDHLSDLSKEEQIAQVDSIIGEFHVRATQTAWVATKSDEHVVGYVSVHWRPCFFLPRQEGYVAELFVEARYRGRQIGQRLLESVIHEARRRGCSHLIVTHNRQRESYQRGFYRCRGWSERPEMAQLVYPLWSTAD